MSSNKKNKSEESNDVGGFSLDSGKDVYVRDPARGKAPPAPEKPKPKYYETVIVLDDSVPSLQVSEKIFDKLGYDVLKFANGKIARDEIAKMSDEELNRIHLIFSDYMMPEMDGVEFLEFIRGHKVLAKAPFILCSAVPDAKAVQKAKAMMVTSFMVKPVSFDKINKFVRILFPKREFPAVI